MESAMKRLPSASMVTPRGLSSLALVGGPPSPPKPTPPVAAWAPPARPAPRHRRDDPCPRVNLADPIIVIVGDEQVPARVEGDAPGHVELCARRGAAVPRETGRPRSRHRRDDPRNLRRGIPREGN